MKAIERIYEYLNYKEVKPIPFEKEIGLSNGYLGKQLKRNANLGEEILNKIIENCPELNPVWILTGKGEMLIEEKDALAENPNEILLIRLDNQEREINRLNNLIDIIIIKLELQKEINLLKTKNIKK